MRLAGKWKPVSDRAFLLRLSLPSLLSMFACLDAAAPPADPAQWEGIDVRAWNAVPRLAWLDILFSFVDVRWDGHALWLAPFQGKPASLHPAGGMLFQGSDRIRPSHVLLVSDGKHMLSDGLRNYRQESIATMLCLWTIAALGLSGLCYELAIVLAAWGMLPLVLWH
jgi:hypothetical protein